MDPKEVAARSAVAAIKSGMAVGLGSGTTSIRALHVLAERIRNEGLRIVGGPTSTGTETEAQALGIPLVTLDERPSLDLAIDGADQVDSRLACIKGYGGALVREKIVARIARRFLVMVDGSKLSRVLDKPVPVEMMPFAAAVAQQGLLELGGMPRWREVHGKRYVTDNGNVILDVDFGKIDDPAQLGRHIAEIPGVVDHGLFVGLVHEVHVGEPGGAHVLHP
jgi:ribose 5-phosphate isomerase A